MREGGLSYARICDMLNAEQVTTPMGGQRWLKSHVDRLLHTRHVHELRVELGLACGRDAPLEEAGRAGQSH